ncbi:uncharacterized protein LOC111437376 [Cucurbita moschata]|uniref:Uncharacterized protein LOC111437376 n=1 Tax=Cucurbita moschata TaxID=3662 RepID=A0A6J1EXD2_CUCMO|nr:uncharacterized protein LOC111437376 [Cucurbita moschata]
MAASVDSPSSSHPNQGSTSFVGSSPLFSPASDKRFWSSLRGRIDSLLEERNVKSSNLDPIMPHQLNTNKSERAKKLKEDSLLLLRGFDSVGYTLSQLSDNLDSALQGARDLVKAPTLTEIFQSNLKNSEVEGGASKRKDNEWEEPKQAAKRKFDDSHCTEESDVDLEKDKQQNPKDKLQKAKTLAVTMATKSASLARELKSLKSNLCFMQERCGILEEENRRLRDGFSRGVRPEEDDLVRLQMEALLAEKSRLANENANLTRENQCLHQLVEYHQLTSQDLSVSYEEVIQGMCLDFSSPPPAIAEEDEEDDEEEETSGTPRVDLFSFSTSLDELHQEEE